MMILKKEYVIALLKLNYLHFDIFYYVSIKNNKIH